LGGGLSWESSWQALAREIKQLQVLKREHAILQDELELLRKGIPVLFQTKTEVFAFTAIKRAGFTLRRLCALYQGDPLGLLRVAVARRQCATAPGSATGGSGGAFVG
jgi:hypothetical protein